VYIYKTIETLLGLSSLYIYTYIYIYIYIYTYIPEFLCTKSYEIGVIELEKYGVLYQMRK